jgi:hypothetical protein
VHEKSPPDPVSLDYPGIENDIRGMAGHTIPRGGICSRKGTSLVSSGGFLAFRSGRESTPQNRYCMLKRRRYKKDVIAIYST